MARLRKFVAYRGLKRPYTRYSKYKGKSYIRVSPHINIARFATGDSKKIFGYRAELVAKSTLNIRDNALESARQTSNRLLEATVGITNYFMRVKPYPYHIIREHALATGAGADRFSSGMAHSFGAPAGNAARVKKGDTIIEVYIDEPNLETATRALKKASKKVPCSCLIRLNDISNKK